MENPLQLETPLLRIAVKKKDTEAKNVKKNEIHLK